MLEFLVALGLSLAVTAAVLALALSSKRLHESDQARTRLNQSLRASRDFLVTDIRQAGERLDGAFPAIQVVRGEDLPGGLAGDPDELVVRRNLLDAVLLLCADLDADDDQITIAVKTAPPPGCAPLPIDTGDAFPSNLQHWSDHRVATGASVAAYIYNPVTRQGEFFTYESEADDALGYYIRKPVGSPDWQFAYNVADKCRIYILEQRVYRLDAGLLQVIVDNDDANPINLVDTLSDFQLGVLHRPTTANPTPAVLDTFDGIGWTDLQTVEITVDGRVDIRERTIRRGWSAGIAPRNAL